MIHPKPLKGTSARKKQHKQPSAMLAQIKGNGGFTHHAIGDPNTVNVTLATLIAYNLGYDHP